MTNPSFRAREHRTLATLVEGSGLVRVLDRAATWMEQAYRHSRIDGWLRPRLAAIASRPQDEQWRRGGEVLVTAVIVHLVLLFARHPETNWRAVVIPAVVAAQGLLLVFASRSGRRH